MTPTPKPKPPAVVFVLWSPERDFNDGLIDVTHDGQYARQCVRVFYAEDGDRACVVRYAPIPPKPRKRAAKRRAR